MLALPKLRAACSGGVAAGVSGAAAIAGVGASLSLIGSFFVQPSVHTGYFGVADHANFVGVLLLLACVALGLIAGARAAIAAVRWIPQRQGAAAVLALLAVALATACVSAVVVQIDPASIMLPTSDAMQVLLGGWFAVLSAAGAAAAATAAWKLHSPPAPRAPAQASAAKSGLAAVVYFGLVLLATASLTPIFNYSLGAYWPFDSPYSLVGGGFGASFRFKLYEDCLVYYATLASLAALAAVSTRLPRVRRFLHRRVTYWRCSCRRASEAKQPSLLLRGVRAMLPCELGVTVGETVVLAVIAGLFTFWVHYWGFSYQRIRVEARGDSRASLQVAARVLGHVATLALSLMAYPLSRDGLLVACFGASYERTLKWHRALGGLAYLLVTAHLATWWVKWTLQELWTRNLLALTVTVSPGQTHWDNWTVLLALLAWVALTVSIVAAVLMRRRAFAWFVAVHRVVGAVFFAVAMTHAWTAWYYMCGGLLLWLFDKALRFQRSAVAAAYACQGTVRVVPVGAAGGAVTKLSVPREALGAAWRAGQFAWVLVPEVSGSEWHPFTIASAPQSDRAEFYCKAMGSSSSWTARLARVGSKRVSVSSGLLALCGDDDEAALDVVVDGPYGCHAACSAYSSVVMVCGGIGVTPMHATLLSLVEELQGDGDPVVAGGQAVALRDVHLVWAVRDRELLGCFADSLRAVFPDGSGSVVGGVRFRLTVRVTGANNNPRALSSDSAGAGPGGAAAGAIQVRSSAAGGASWLEACAVEGRPDVRGAVVEAAACGRGGGAAERGAGEDPSTAPLLAGGGQRAAAGAALCMVCGPASMVAAAADACCEADVELQEEVFSL